METENNTSTNTEQKGNTRMVVVVLVLGMLFLGGYYVYENFFKASVVEDENQSQVDYSEVAGTYTATVPSADSAGRSMTVIVTDEGLVTLTTDYMNGQPVIEEKGFLESETLLTITEMDGQELEHATILPIEFSENQVVIGAGTDEFGEGIILTMGTSATTTPTPNPTASSGTVGLLTANKWMWKDTQMSDDSTIVPKDPSLFVLTFMADGTFNTTTDCNSGSGSYTATDSGSLTFGPTASTKMFCEGSSETEYYKELGDVVSYMIKDGNLYLSMKMDSGVMEFTPVSN